MAYIYKITNLINQKSYIGKTNFSIEKRWKEHCSDATKRDEEHRPLYSAIKKYGIENFSIEEIEEVSELQSGEREKFWIEYYGTFKNGYNATVGGDGKQYIDYDLVVVMYLELQNQSEVARRLGIHSSTVATILESKKIQRLDSGQVTQSKLSKSIIAYNLNNEFIDIFNSGMDAARWLQKNNIAIGTKMESISSRVLSVAKGQRKTAYGFIWKFPNQN